MPNKVQEKAQETLALVEEVNAVVLPLDADDIPAKEAEVQAAPEGDQVMKAQELRDLRAARDDLERRVHDLKLTRQVTMQSLPSIRLVQENDKSLVTKINSTLVNTVPLWETQLAQAVTIQRSAEAAAAVRDANDLTNELLTSNAANLRESNKMIREEMERGVFDIEAVKQANADLIGTIEESLQIADEGKAKRAAAEAELKKMEADLRDTLASAKAPRAARQPCAGGAPCPAGPGAANSGAGRPVRAKPRPCHLLPTPDERSAGARADAHRWWRAGHALYGRDARAQLRADRVF